MNGQKRCLYWTKTNSLSDDEYEFDFFEDFNENVINVVDDEQNDLFLPNNVREEEDLMDNGFENFVEKEGPNQVMHLILEKQGNNVQFDEIFDFKDFEDLLKCIA